MKVKRFLLISFLLTVLLIAAAAVTLMQKKDYDSLIMMNFCIFEFAAVSWILTLIDFILYLFGKKYLPGLKSYKIMTILLFIGNLIFSISTMIMEKTFDGSSAQMILYYLQPLIIAVYIVMFVIGKKKEEERGLDK